MLYDDVAGLSSPQYLAANAAALGMVIDESPNYLRLSDGALLGAGQSALGASSVDAIGRGDRRQRAHHRHPARHRSRRHDRGRPGRDADRRAVTATESRTLRRRSPTDCPPRAHTEHMVTRATRSPRRRTVVALAVVLAVLAGFIVRLVDIQVVNAGEHIADSLRHALGGSQTALRHPRVDRRRDRPDARRQRPPVRLPARPALNAARSTARRPTADVERRSRGRSSPVEIAEHHRPDGRGGAADRRRRARRRPRLAVRDARSAACRREQLPRARRARHARTSYFDPHPARTYPDGAVAGNLVGFMGIDGEALEGLEKTEDSCLAATNGTRRLREGQGRRRHPRHRGREQPAVDGGTLQLTINRDLQWYLQQLIGEQAQDMGAKRGGDHRRRGGDRQDPRRRGVPERSTPTTSTPPKPDDRGSRIFRDSFEPGSTFKALTAATVIDAGGQTPTVHRRRVGRRDVRQRGDASATRSITRPTPTRSTGVLIDSSNAGISKFSERVSAQTRYDYFKKFGIGGGSARRVRRRGATAGIHPVDEWDNQTFYNTAFGQGCHDDDAGARRRVRGDRERRACGCRSRSSSRARRPTARSSTPELPEPTRVDQQETTAAQMQPDPRERRAAGAATPTQIADPRLPHRRQDRHRREVRRQRRLQGGRVLHDDDRVRPGRGPAVPRRRHARRADEGKVVCGQRDRRSRRP